MWMTISSISAMLAFSDFGMGNGLLSKVASASGRDDRESAARSVASAFFMLTGMAFITLSVLAISYRFTPWGRILNLSSVIGNAEAGPAVAIFCVCFALNLPLGVVQRVQMAYQETYQSNLWQCLGSVAGFAALLCVIHARAGLPWLIAAFSGTPVLVNGLNLCVQFKIVRPWLAPRLRNFDLAGSKELLGTGLLFLSIQVGASIAFYADNFIIAQLLGPSEVARYSVGVRLFSIVSLIPQILFAPLWPAYGEAHARGDMQWIRTTLRRTALFGLAISGSVGLCLLAVAPWFIARWTRGSVVLPFSLLLALFVSTIVFSSSYPHGIFLWGLNALRFSAISMALVAVSSIVVKLMIIPSLGSAGAAWGTASCYLVFATLPNLYYSGRLLKRTLVVQNDGESAHIRRD